MLCIKNDHYLPLGFPRDEMAHTLSKLIVKESREILCWLHTSP